MTVTAYKLLIQNESRFTQRERILLTRHVKKKCHGVSLWVNVQRRSATTSQRYFSVFDGHNPHSAYANSFGVYQDLYTRCNTASDPYSAWEKKSSHVEIEL